MPKHQDSKGRKRKKNYYVQFQKKARVNTLEAGSQGFLLTCNNDERRCIREAYNILNEFANPALPETKDEKKDALIEEDVEEDLERELKSLKEGSAGERHFHQVYTGIKSCLFIQTKLEPCPILLRILEAIRTSGKQRTVSTQRMLPVLGSCKAHLDNLRKTLKEVIDRLLLEKDLYGTDRKLQYAVLFKARHNDSLKKDEVVTTVIDMVHSEGIPWEPEPRTPDCAISVDVLSSICCISVLPFYKKYKRYNLVEVAKSDSEISTKMDGDGMNRTDNNRVTLISSDGTPDNQTLLEKDKMKDSQNPDTTFAET